ncbi:hypothetical protein ACTFIZ_012698 [Dictyostelium cf. discoideum]
MFQRSHGYVLFDSTVPSQASSSFNCGTSDDNESSKTNYQYYTANSNSTRWFLCGSTQPAQQIIDGLLNYIDINNISSNNNNNSSSNSNSSSNGSSTNSNSSSNGRTNSSSCCSSNGSSTNSNGSSSSSSSSSGSINLNKKSIGGNLLSLSIGTSGDIGSTTINTTLQTKNNSGVTSVKQQQIPQDSPPYLYNCIGSGISREISLGRDYIGSNSTNSSSSPSFKFNWAFNI